VHFFRHCHAGGSSSAFLLSFGSLISGSGKYSDMVKISAGCPLPVVNRDSMVIHVRQVLVCAAGKAPFQGVGTQRVFPGPPHSGFRCNVRSCEVEVPCSSIMKGALLRLANPVGGVRPGQVARRLRVHRAVMLYVCWGKMVVTVLFVHLMLFSLGKLGCLQFDHSRQVFNSEQIAAP